MVSHFAILSAKMVSHFAILSAKESMYDIYAPHPICQKFPHCCFWNSSNAEWMNENINMAHKEITASGLTKRRKKEENKKNGLRWVCTRLGPCLQLLFIYCWLIAQSVAQSHHRAFHKFLFCTQVEYNTKHAHYINVNHTNIIRKLVPSVSHS